MTEHHVFEVSVAFLPLLFVAVAFGPLAAAVVGALTMVGRLRRPVQPLGAVDG